MSFIGAVATSVRQVPRSMRRTHPLTECRRELYRPERAALAGFAGR
ncbi:MAG: hypothetical protein ACLT2T_11635 [Bilophila wadsworthia]